MKKLLAPKSKEMPHAVLDNHYNLLTDPVTIRNEYKTEFQHRFRKRDIRSDLEWYESSRVDYVNFVSKLLGKFGVQISHFLK